MKFLVLVFCLLLAPAPSLMGQSDCSYTVSPSSASIPSAGGAGSFSVTASNQTCSYNIYNQTETGSNTANVTIPQTSGTGSETFSYTVSAESGHALQFVAVGNITLDGSYDGAFFTGNIDILPITTQGANSPSGNPNMPPPSPNTLLETPVVLPPAVIGQNYGPYQLQATGGVPPYTWNGAEANCSGCINVSTSGVVSSNGPVAQYYGAPILLTEFMSLNDSAMNADGSNNREAVALPTEVLLTAPPSALPASPLILDPTPLLDPTSKLMDGDSITTDRNLLASGGRPVQGIAADGTAEILIRIPTATANDSITVTVLTDDCATPNTPSSCLISLSPEDDGGLLNLSDASVPSKASPIATDAADANNFAYVIYRAPIDFVRNDGESTDAQITSRQVQLQVDYSLNGTKYGTVFLPLLILRSPVVLVHGYTSNAQETWGDFEPLLGDAQTHVFWADYGQITSMKNLMPPQVCVPGNCTYHYRSSQLGFTYNTPRVANQIVHYISYYASGLNPLSIPIAVSQTDIVAHSMGGLIARYWSTEPGSAAFATPANFGQGYIHKLVTLGTPHTGTSLATLQLNQSSGCSRQLGSIAGRQAILTATVGNVTALGAVGELYGDGIGTYMNPSLTALNSQSASLWTATIAGSITNIPSGRSESLTMFLFYHACPSSDPVSTRYTPDLYGTLFDPAITQTNPTGTGENTPSDGAVPVTSALKVVASACSNSLGTCFLQYAHGQGTSTVTGVNSFLVDGSGIVATKVQSLLNTSVLDSTVWIKQ